MTLPELNTPVWPAKGIAPSQPGDMVYSAGEQPIAPYDNRAMWNVTRDIHNLRDTLGTHVSRHETGGSDELDLQNLTVNGLVAVNADTDANEVRWVDTSTNTTVTRLDVDNGVWRQSPDFADNPTFNAGFALTDNIDDTGGTLLYDSAAGSTGKFHHAKHADTADSAAWADVAGALEDSNGTQYQPGDFLTAGEDATISGSWSFTPTVDADISGNAASADHATTADSATEADHATTAGDADTVDNYHAQEIIDAASSTGEWDRIASTTHSTVGDPFVWQHQSSTVYDRYRLTIYHETHKSSGVKAFFYLQLGSGGTVDERNRYRWLERDIEDQDWSHHYEDDGFTLAGVNPQTVSTSVYYIDCPRAVNAPDEHWPTVSVASDGADRDVPRYFINGALRTNYSTIDTVKLTSGFDTSTGKIVLEGKDL